MKVVEASETYCDGCGDFTNCARLDGEDVVLEIFRKSEGLADADEEVDESHPEFEARFFYASARGWRCLSCGNEFSSIEIPAGFYRDHVVDLMRMRARISAMRKGGAHRSTPLSRGKPIAAEVDPNAETEILLTPSAVLAAVVGSAPLSKAEATSRLWSYIKKNGLQDAENKRQINVDDKLTQVFGGPSVTMFEMANQMSKHLR